MDRTDNCEIEESFSMRQQGMPLDKFWTVLIVIYFLIQDHLNLFYVKKVFP